MQAFRTTGCSRLYSWGNGYDRIGRWVGIAGEGVAGEGGVAMFSNAVVSSSDVVVVGASPEAL